MPKSGSSSATGVAGAPLAIRGRPCDLSVAGFRGIRAGGTLCHVRARPWRSARVPCYRHHTGLNTHVSLPRPSATCSASRTSPSAARPRRPGRSWRCCGRQARAASRPRRSKHRLKQLRQARTRANEGQQEVKRESGSCRPQAAPTARRATPPPTSRCWKASSRCGAGPACTSAAPTRRRCTTCSPR